MASVTAYPNGPCVVRGIVRLLDERGREIELRRRAIALCRCGRSRIHPFCDATHKQVGFRAPGGRWEGPGEALLEVSVPARGAADDLVAVADAAVTQARRQR